MNRKWKDAEISRFNAGWWFYFFFSLLLLFFFSAIAKDLPSEKKYHWILALSIFNYLYLRLYKFSLKNIRPNYNYYNELPCYLCNQTSILSIFTALFQWKLGITLRNCSSNFLKEEKTSPLLSYL